MKRYYTKSELIHGISYLLLFLFAFRFANKNNTFLLLFVTVSFGYCLVRKLFRPTLECFILLLYGLFYYYTSVYWGGKQNMTEFLTLAVGAPLMYFAGQHGMMFAENKEQYYKNIVWVVATGMFLFAMLSYAKNGIIYNYEPGMDLRQVPDLWVGSLSLWQATNINGYCVFAVVLSLITLIQQNSIIKKLYAIVLFVGSIYLSLITASRTNLFLVVLVIVVYTTFVLYIKGSRMRYVEREQAKKSIGIIALGIVVTQIIVVNLEYVLMRLPLEAFIERLSNRQISISEDSRWEMWKTVIEEIPSHFWGNITKVQMAHNIYLDVARTSGVIPMVLLFIFTIMILFTMFKTFNSGMSYQLKLINSVLICSLLVSFLIEPVMNAKPFVFIVFCMVCGMQNEIIRWE